MKCPTPTKTQRWIPHGCIWLQKSKLLSTQCLYLELTPENKLSKKSKIYARRIAWSTTNTKLWVSLFCQLQSKFSWGQFVNFSVIGYLSHGILEVDVMSETVAFHFVTRSGLHFLTLLLFPSLLHCVPVQHSSQAITSVPAFISVSLIPGNKVLRSLPNIVQEQAIDSALSAANETHLTRLTLKDVLMTLSCKHAAHCLPPELLKEAQDDGRFSSRNHLTSC